MEDPKSQRIREMVGSLERDVRQVERELDGQIFKGANYLLISHAGALLAVLSTISEIKPELGLKNIAIICTIFAAGLLSAAAGFLLHFLQAGRDNIEMLRRKLDFISASVTDVDTEQPEPKSANKDSPPKGAELLMISFILFCGGVGYFVFVLWKLALE